MPDTMTIDDVAKTFDKAIKFNQMNTDSADNDSLFAFQNDSNIANITNMDENQSKPDKLEAFMLKINDKLHILQSKIRPGKC